MKTNLRFIQVMAAGFMLGSGAAFAQSSTMVTTTSSTSSDGTVSDLSPNVITVRSTTSSAPLAYSYSKTTTYVDENGNPVTTEAVHSGAPVTVYYTQDGGTMTATRVVVHRTTTESAPAPDNTTTVKKTTTTVTTTPNP